MLGFAIAQPNLQLLKIMIQFDFIADKSCHRGTGILPVTESWPTYSNEQLTINNDRKNALSLYIKVSQQMQHFCIKM